MSLQKIKNLIIDYYPPVITAIIISALVYFVILPATGLHFYFKISPNGSWMENEKFVINSSYVYKNDNGANITIYIEKGTDTQSVITLIKNLDEMPGVLVKECNNISISYESIEDRMGFDKTDKIKVVALSSERYIYLMDEYVDKDTIIHELSHIYDYLYSITDSDEFINLSNRNTMSNIVSKANALSLDIYEVWANANIIYWRNPEEVYLKDSEIYRFFEDVYSNDMYKTTDHSVN